MGKNKKKKMIIIIILVLAITGLSIGLATFSNVLTISSSATVKPNAEEYNLTIYGFDTDPSSLSNNLTLEYVLTNYLSSSIAVPINYGDKTLADIATIDNNAFAIRNISVLFATDNTLNFTNNEGVAYVFFIKNEGAHHIYFNKLKLKEMISSYGGKKCTSNESVAQEKLDFYCDFIQSKFSFLVPDGGGDLTLLDINTIDTNYTLSPNSYICLVVEIIGVTPDYEFTNEDIENEFTILFDDILLDFAATDIYSE